MRPVWRRWRRRRQQLANRLRGLRPQQQFLALLGVLAALAISPFAVWRAVTGDWHQALVDLFIVALLAAIAGLGGIERHFRLAAGLFAIFYAVGIALVVARLGAEALYWVYPAAVAVFFILRAHEALVLSLIGVVINAWVGAATAPASVIGSFVVTSLLVCLFAYLFSARMFSDNRRLAAEATLDGLTGVGNRRLLDDTLRRLTASGKATGHALVLLDIDHFKRVNDDHGHLVGDLCLTRLAQRVRRRLAPGQSLYRYGGEEFVVLLPGDSELAAALAEGLRRMVAADPLIRERDITLSAGVAGHRPGQSASDWLGLADAALYEAKQRGRNRVLVARAGGYAEVTPVGGGAASAADPSSAAGRPGHSATNTDTGAGPKV